MLVIEAHFHLFRYKSLSEAADLLKEKHEKTFNYSCTEAILPYTGVFLIAAIYKTESDSVTVQRFVSNAKHFVGFFMPGRLL